MIYIYIPAKDEIEQIYSNRSRIQLRSSGHGGFSGTEHSTNRIYMGNGGVIKYSIFGGKMKVTEVYYSKDEFNNFLSKKKRQLKT